MELKKALIYWRESTNGGESSVCSHAFTIAGKRLLVVPSKVGVVDRENPLICRLTEPLPNQAELVLLRQATSTAGHEFYIAFPFDNKLLDLPGVKDYHPISMGGVSGDLLKTHFFEDGKYIRIFKSHTKYPHSREDTQDLVSWADLGAVGMHETIKCRIMYKMARDNRLVGEALPSVDSYRRKLGLIRIPIISGQMLTENYGKYEMIIPKQDSAFMVNVQFREVGKSNWITSLVYEADLLGLVRDRVYIVGFSEDNGHRPGFRIKQY